MARAVDDVKNWMNMFRWIVKLIRDEYEIDEAMLTRTAVLETDCGLMIEQVEATIASEHGMEPDEPDSARLMCSVQKNNERADISNARIARESP